MWCPDVKVGKEEQINLHLEMQLVNLSVFFDLRGDSLSRFVQHRFTQALMFHEGHEGAFAQAAHHHDTCVALTCSSNFPSTVTLSSFRVDSDKH